MFTCDYCQYISNKSFNVKRHDARNHNNQTDQQLEFKASFQQQRQEAIKLIINMKCLKNI